MHIINAEKYDNKYECTTSSEYNFIISHNYYPIKILKEGAIFINNDILKVILLKYNSKEDKNG